MMGSIMPRALCGRSRPMVWQFSLSSLRESPLKVASREEMRKVELVVGSGV